MISLFTMKGHLIIALLVATAVFGTFWYQTTAHICPVPLNYRLGQLDAEFGITASRAQSYILEAENYWEDATGQDLFVYDDRAEFTFNFQFDERQEVANDEEQARMRLDEQSAESDAVKDTLLALQAEYEALVASHREAVELYETDLISYNQRVSRYNDQGGAPPEVFAELEAEREALNQQSTELNRTSQEINTLASQINEVGERGNRLVEAYNREVAAYNEEFGRTGEFTQGDYQGDRINIYKFSSENELVTVLAHEFGHALGMGHVDDEMALMYYLLEDPNGEPEITAADLQIFYEVCGTEETFASQTRRVIRNLLALI
jgi:hypothetical protein